MTGLVALGVAAWFVLRPRINADVDSKGFFLGRGAPTGADVYPGREVLFVFRSHDGSIAGRVADGATEPTVWVRGTDGELKETPLFTRDAAPDAGSGIGFESPVREAIDEELERHAPFDRAIGVFRRAAPRTTFGRQRIAPDAWPPPGRAPSPHEVRSGLDLADWAPAGTVFVRFRSVESAYRFADEADRLAGALRAVTLEFGRDYGTLRLALHDLLLPTIWRANPESERGVGELALVVEQPFAPGRLRLAVIFRVTDSELHRMQTEAGVALESSPGHLWRPTDDPVPAERARRNFRRRVEDVEIVATDADLLERIASRFVAPVAEEPDYRTARRTGPASDEAFFAYNDVTSWESHWRGEPLSARRELRGIESLWRKWLGETFQALDLDGPAVWPNKLQGILSVAATTDARGAAVSVTCRTPAVAGEFAGVLRGLPSAGPAVDRACLHNLGDLLPLALVENPQDDVAERNFVVLGWKPVCPCGGTYSVHPITREPSCSVHGTVKKPRAGKWTPPPIGDVKVEGSELSLRLAIDWNRKQ